MKQVNVDTFFSDLQNVRPYLKIAAQGAAGSGKTRTLTEIAIGLYKRIGSTKPITFFDSETASKFIIPILAKHGIRAVVKYSRSLEDLEATMQLVQSGGQNGEPFSDILIVDSITHVYDNYLDQYKQKKKRDFFEFQDWGVLKPEWKKRFSEPLVAAKCHILFTGREGYTYEDVETNRIGEDGKKKKQKVQSGYKMKAEGETAYEPDILFRMEADEELIGDKPKVVRVCTVIKDRADIIDGKQCIDPTYSFFEPVVEFVLAGVGDIPKTVSLEGATDMFAERERVSNQSGERRKEWERIEANLDKICAGTSVEAKKRRTALLDLVFAEVSETAIQEKNLESLQYGRDQIEKYANLISRIEKGEPIVYQSAKTIDQARVEKFGTTDLIEVGFTDLEKYLQHLLDTAKGKKGAAA